MNVLRNAQCPQESAGERFVARAGASNWRHAQTLAGEVGPCGPKVDTSMSLYIAANSMAFDPRQSALIGPTATAVLRPTCVETRPGTTFGVTRT